MMYSSVFIFALLIMAKNWKKNQNFSNMGLVAEIM